MKMNYKFILGMLLFSTQLMTSQAVMEVMPINADSNETSAIVIVRYQYFPNLEAYFDTKKLLYIYMVNGQWVSTPTISDSYRGYCVRNGFHVALDGYVGETPYTLLAQHKLKFPADFSSKRRPKVVVALD